MTAADEVVVRKPGGLAIAQDQASSVVYGIPRQAVLQGAAEAVPPVEAIGSALIARAATG